MGLVTDQQIRSAFNELGIIPDKLHNNPTIINMVSTINKHKIDIEKLTENEINELLEYIVVAAS